MKGKKTSLKQMHKPNAKSASEIGHVNKPKSYGKDKKEEKIALR